MIKSVLNKGFTLIELLAIIVILAVISVITVPIILNIIDGSKKGAAINSSYGYKDAVNEYYLNNLDVDDKLNGTYSVLFLEELGINVNGNKPVDGWISINNGVVTDYSYIIGDYVVTSVSNNVDVFTGEIVLSSNPVIRRIRDGVQYYETNWIKKMPIFYNPIEGKVCNGSDDSDIYKNDNSKIGYNGVNPSESQSSCLKWFLYSRNSDGSYNLLLDHNTTATIAWNPVPISGPSTDFLQSLYDGTIGWNGVPTRSDSYDFNSRGRVYSLDYNGFKARTISAEEIALITGNLDWTVDLGTDHNYYFDTLSVSRNKQIDSKDESLYSWLFTNTSGCERYGCQVSQSGSSGYWTSSAAPRATTYAWHVGSSGWIYSNGYYYSSSNVFGIRPVISINL